MRMITRNLYNSAESTIWRIVMLNHHESLLIITIMMNPYIHTYTYIYIHSIPQKKDRRLFEVWILLFYPCFVQELLWYTHTHTVIFKEKPNWFPKWKSYTGFTSICPDFQHFPTVQPLFGSYYIIVLMDNILPRSIWSLKENRWAGFVLKK